MWTWWFIAHDDEAPLLLDEEEGDRPSLSLPAWPEELRVLGELLGAAYEPRQVFMIDAERVLDRVPLAFVVALAALEDPQELANAWAARAPSLDASERELAEVLREARSFAAEALRGPGLLVYREL